MNRNGSILLIDERGREAGRYQIVYGATLKVSDGQKVEEGQELAEWDPGDAMDAVVEQFRARNHPDWLMAARVIETLDAFCDAMIQIAREAETDPARAHEAPVTTPVRRLDQTKAAREPDLRWRARA